VILTSTLAPETAADRAASKHIDDYRTTAKRVGGQVAHDARVAGEATSCASGDEQVGWRAPRVTCFVVVARLLPLTSGKSSFGVCQDLP
jgi:hypothetical protein